MKQWMNSIRRSQYYRKSSLTALIVNLIFMESLLFVIGYLWFVYRTGNPLLSLLLTLLILTLLTMAFVMQQGKSFRKKKAEIRRQTGRDFLAEELKQLNSDEFKWQVTRLLMNLEGVSDIREQESFLETCLHGRKTAIGIYHDSFDEEVPPRRLADFLNQARVEGFPQAVFVASGSYSDSCRTMVEKKSSIRVQLLDLNDLLDKMEQVGMFPDEKTIDTLIDRAASNRRQKLKAVKNEMVAPKRIRTYLGYSLFFYVLSRFFPTLSLYYVLVSLVFLFLALLACFLWAKNKKRAKTGEQLLDPPVSETHQGS